MEMDCEMTANCDMGVQ